MVSEAIPNDSLSHTATAAVVGMGPAGIGNNAENLHIDGVEINNASTIYKDSNVYNIQDGGSRLAAARDEAKKKLLEHVVIGAMHNSEERCDAPKCHPETRAAVQDEILGWLSSSLQGNRSEEKRIKWVAAPAGGGKTAIMGSVAETCQEKGQLAASFFFSSFSGSVHRRSKKRFVPTLAYQVHQHPQLQHAREHILDAIVAEPAIFDMRLEVQAKMLILEPLRRASTTLSAPFPLAILVDGLDECDITSTVERDPRKQMVQPPRTKEDDQTEILHILATLAADPCLPFRIVIASRPEPHIRCFFPDEGYIFLDNKYNPDRDIELYLRAMFEDIRRRYNLPKSWVSDEDIRTLVENASGQFIYAATVIRYINDRSNHPSVQLDFVLGRQRPTSKRPFENLDALYTAILEASSKPVTAVKWIRVFVIFPLTHSELGSLHQRCFMETQPGETEFLFSGLSALVNVSRSPKPPLFSFYHKSFLDFLGDSSRRCGRFFLSLQDVREAIWDCIIERVLYRRPTAPFPDLYEEPLYLADFHRTFCNRLIHLIWLNHSIWRGRYIKFSERQLSLLEQCDAEGWIKNNILRQKHGFRFIAKIYILVHTKCPTFGPHHPACTRWSSAFMAWATQNPQELRLRYSVGHPKLVTSLGPATLRWVIEDKWDVFIRKAQSLIFMTSRPYLYK